MTTPTETIESHLTTALDALQSAKGELFEANPSDPGPEHKRLSAMIHELYDMRARLIEVSQ